MVFWNRRIGRILATPELESRREGLGWALAEPRGGVRPLQRLQARARGFEADALAVLTTAPIADAITEAASVAALVSRPQRAIEQARELGGRQNVIEAYGRAIGSQDRSLGWIRQLADADPQGIPIRVDRGVDGEGQRRFKGAEHVGG